MKKLFAIVMLLAILCALAACGNKTNHEEVENNASSFTVDMKALMDQFREKFTLVEPNEVTNIDRVCTICYVDKNDVKDFVYVMTMGGAFPQELIMFEANNAEAAARIAEKLNVKLQDLLNQSANYDADTNAILKECKVEVVGSYVHLFIHPAHAQMREMFNAAKK